MESKGKINDGDGFMATVVNRGKPKDCDKLRPKKGKREIIPSLC